MPGITIKAPAYAASLGITRRCLRLYIQQKMPGASKRRGLWRIDPGKAEPWLREKHPSIFELETLIISCSGSPPESDKQPNGIGNSESDITIRIGEEFLAPNVFDFVTAFVHQLPRAGIGSGAARAEVNSSGNAIALSHSSS